MSSDNGNGIDRPYGTALPDGIKHLHGSMYLVRFDLLKVPDPDAKEVQVDGKKQYEFRNPRTLTEKGQSVLFDKKKSEEMRESIREKTLMTAFVARWRREEDGLVVQMVGGERRHRALDWLRKKKEMVKDPRTAKLNADMEYEYDWAPADQVYEYVLCSIFAVTNDIEALSLSYTENDCRVNQGPGNDIAMVIELRQCGATDEDIMKTMSKDEKWLRDTDNIIAGLDPDSLHDLIEDRIDREAALELISIKERFGEEIAGQALNLAHEAAAKDYKKKFERLTRRIGDALTEKEIAEGFVADAEWTGEGLDGAKASVVEASAKVNRTVKERAESKPTTDKGHIRAGFRSAQETNGVAPTPKSTVLRFPKIKQHFIEPLADLVKRGGKCPKGKFVADPDALRLCLTMVRAIAGGDTEMEEIVRLHYKNKPSSVQSRIEDVQEEDDDE